jgi:multidrug efflux system membrane fusion protein
LAERDVAALQATGGEQQAGGENKPMKVARKSLMMRGGVLCLAIIPLACTKKPAEPRAFAAPVVVATAAQKDMPLEINGIGNVEAITGVQIKSMINGEITTVNFKEGQDVRKGDLLFTLDAVPYEADLRNKEATLARDIATAENARADARRYQALFKEGVVASQQTESMQAAADAADALVRADRAAVENAKAQLRYTKIYSPIRGRTGNLSIQLGNVIKANDLPLLSINQIDPIYVTFTIPEQSLGDVKRYMAQHNLKVSARLPNDPLPAEGILTFIDNEVDRQTGTIKLKGTFANADHRLWPGQFVEVTLTLMMQPNVVVVPAQAVQDGQQGQFVFVVDKDMKAQSRQVSVSRTIAGQSVVAKGIDPGEVVVTDGQSRLTPGAKVEFKNQ